MAISAAIKFVQGILVGTAGVALVGDLSTLVTATNGNDADVDSWKWTMVDVPAASGVATGVISTANNATFTPDARGGYHLELEVKDLAGATKTARLVFLVLEQSGRKVPPFDAIASGLNFGGGTRGWTPIMESYLRAIDGRPPRILTATGAINDAATIDAFGEAEYSVRFTGAAPVISGFGGGYEGRRLLVYFTNTTTIQNEGAGSIAANRVATSSGGSATFPAGSSALITYDASRWRIMTTESTSLPGGVDGSVQYKSGSSFAGSLSTLIHAASGALILAATVGAAPATGDLRMPSGGAGGDGWFATMRNGTDTEDLMTQFGYVTGGGDSIYGIGHEWGDVLLSGAPEPTQTTDFVLVGANKGIVLFMSEIMDDVINGVTLQRYPTGNVHLFSVDGQDSGTNAANFAVLGSRSGAVDPENLLAEGRGVFYFGRARTNPNSLTPPTLGITQWVSAARDDLSYLRPNGSIAQLDGAVRFDDSTPAARRNIRSDRFTDQSPMTNSFVGMTAFGSVSNDAGGPYSGTVQNNYATVGGGAGNYAYGEFATIPGGERNDVRGKWGLASGYRCFANGENSVAFGRQVVVGQDLVAHGVQKNGGFGVGATMNLFGEYGFGAGSNNGIHVDSAYATVIGQNNTAGDASNLATRGGALGFSCYSLAPQAWAIGEGSEARGQGSVALCGISISRGSYSFAAGWGAETGASASGAISLGRLTSATGTYAVALGKSTIASGAQSTAFGDTTTASNTGSIAGGTNVLASGPSAIAFGTDVTVSQSFGFGAGYSISISGAGGVAIGEVITIVDANQHAIGYQHTFGAGATYATSIGYNNTVAANATQATAIGSQVTVSVPGEVGFSGGGLGLGYHLVPMNRDLNATPGTLQTLANGGLTLSGFTIYHVRVRVTANTLDDSKRASETYELQVYNQNGGVGYIDSPSRTGRRATSLEVYGWTLAFSQPGSNELRLTFNPGADNVRVHAYVEWIGRGTATGNATTPALAMAIVPYVTEASLSNGFVPVYNSTTRDWVATNPASMLGGFAGTDTQVLFNDGGTTIAGDPGLTFNKTTNRLDVTGGISLNAVAAAATGVVRFAHVDDLICVRNAAGSADLTALAATSNFLLIGGNAAGAQRFSVVAVDYTSSFLLRRAGTTRLELGATSSDFASFGASPAQTGAGRFSNNSFVYWRNAADSVDMLAIGYDSANKLLLGDPSAGEAMIRSSIGTSISTPYVILGPGAVSTTGTVRMAPDTTVKYNAGGVDRPAFEFTSGANIILGGSGVTDCGAIINRVSTSGAIHNQVAGNAHFTISGTNCHVGASGTGVQLRFGVNHASAGAICLLNNTAIRFRNTANDGDVTGMFVATTTNDLILGSDNDLVSNRAANVAIYPTGSVFIGSSNVTGLRVTQNVLTAYGGIFETTFSNPASTGAIRMGNAQSIYARNVGNSANQELLGFTSSDDVFLASPGLSGQNGRFLYNNNGVVAGQSSFSWDSGTSSVLSNGNFNFSSAFGYRSGYDLSTPRFNARCFPQVTSTTTGTGTLASLATLTDSVEVIKVTSVIVRSDGAKIGSHVQYVTIGNDGGTPFVGTPTVAHTFDSDWGDTKPTYTTSGTNVIVQYTGFAATTMRWHVYIERFQGTEAVAA